MRTSTLLALTALLLLLPAGARAQASLPPIPDLAYERFGLDNGLTLLVHEDHKAPIVAVNVWYHVGAKDEPAGRSGYAHFFEHIMFNGSEHYMERAEGDARARPVR